MNSRGHPSNSFLDVGGFLAGAELDDACLGEPRARN
jgi:hypothetical protein